MRASFRIYFSVPILILSGISLLYPGSPAFGEESNQAPQAIMPEKHHVLFEKYCLDCHDADTEKGSVNLEDLSFTINDIATAELWQKVLNATNAGEMPPQKKKQLLPEEKTDFLADLSRQLVVARETLSDSGGLITMRRLNRREYENTIESLLGVSIHAEDLPDDANPGGFDTTGSALFFSSDQFEQYLKIARRALEQSLVYGPQPETKTVRVESEQSANKQIKNLSGRLEKIRERVEAYRNSGGKPATDFGFIDDARVKFEERVYRNNRPAYQQYLEHPGSRDGILLFHFFRGNYGPEITLPPNYFGGRFKIRARIALLDEKVPEHRRYIEFGTTNKSAQAGEINVSEFRRITGTMDSPQIIEFEVTPQNDLRTFMIRERHVNSSAAAKRFYTQSLARNGHGPSPALWVDWVEWEGPFFETWPPASHVAIHGPENKSNPNGIREIVERFATRAFRTKKPSPAYVDKLMGQYQDRIGAGEKPRPALIETLSLVLASPGFLYLNEPNFGAQRRELEDNELAVRLSYFLWSAPPDDELWAVANQGKLKAGPELKKQTLRMLKDPRSREFINGFAHQWLGMERLDFFQFNYQKYPRFDTSVKESARNEVYDTIRDAILNDRPIGELLKSDHVMVNNLLASYYGISGVEGEEFHRVRVPAGLPRGGLLGMTAVMAMGSDGERSSPVERGAWVLRKLLNDPPPPAPANVPQLSRLEDKHLSAREMQKAHQEEAQCAQCHRTIDPIGFGLENFDATGLWREVETFQLKPAEIKKARQAGRKLSNTIKIDPSGQLPDGTEFANFFELRDLIAEKEAQFARGYTEHLIEYAMGRPYGFSDHNMADRIMERAARKKYSMSEFIIAVVQAKRFRMK